MSEEIPNDQPVAQSNGVDYKEKLDSLLAQCEQIKNNVLLVEKAVNDVAVSANNSNAKVNEAVGSANTQLTSLTETVSGAKTKVADVEKFMPGFEALRVKLEQKDTGLQASLDKMIQIVLDGQTTKEEIIKEKVRAEDIIKQSIDLKEEIVALKNVSLTFRNEIGEILDLVRDTGLSNSFDRTRKRSQKRLIYLGGSILIGVVIGVVLIYFLFIHNNGSGLFAGVESGFMKLVYRLTLTSPAVFLIWFCSLHFSRERKILSQYEHNTATAIGLENYAKLLKDKFPDPTYEMLRYELIVGFIKQIYQPPIYSKDRMSFLARIFFPGAKNPTEIGVNTE